MIIYLFHISRKRNCLFAYDSITGPTQSHIMRVSCSGQSPHSLLAPQRSLSVGSGVRKKQGDPTASELRGRYQRPEPFLFPRQRLQFPGINKMPQVSLLFSCFLDLSEITVSGFQNRNKPGKHKPHLEVFRGMWIRTMCRFHQCSSWPWETTALRQEHGFSLEETDPAPIFKRRHRESASEVQLK